MVNTARPCAGMLAGLLPATLSVAFVLATVACPTSLVVLRTGTFWLAAPASIGVVIAALRGRHASTPLGFGTGLCLLCPLAVLGPWEVDLSHLGIAFSGAESLGRLGNASLPGALGLVCVLVASLGPAVLAIAALSAPVSPRGLRVAALAQLAVWAGALVHVDFAVLAYAAAWLVGDPPTALEPPSPLPLWSRLEPASYALASLARAGATLVLVVASLHHRSRAPSRGPASGQAGGVAPRRLR